MRNILLLVTVTLGFIGCTSIEGASAEERKNEFASLIDEPTEITFETPTHNFGTVVDGDMVKHSFKFTNTGDKDLVLFGVNATCGCTVPEDWPKNPIAPGEGGEIKVIFNSLNKVGAVNKTVNVEANTNPTVSRITIMGEVLAKKQ
jgi:hypothetical protein